MITLFAISFLFTYLSNLAINKGDKLLFHRFDLAHMLFGAVGFILALKDSFHWIQLIGFVVALIPIYTTIFHIYLHGKTKGLKYFGDGHGSLFEDIIRILAGCDYATNKNRYENTSLLVRFFMLTIGVILILWHF